MNTEESLFGRIDEVRATLRIDGQPDDALAVLSFKGTEKLSKNFVYEVTVASSAETAAGLDDALGRDVVLTLGRVGQASNEFAAHIVHGMIQKVCPSGVATGKSQRQTVLRIVPRLAELCHRQRCQVFQDVTVVDIARELFKTWEIRSDAQMQIEPLKRDYCTQVNETDFDFLKRILSEEGIHFYFDSYDDKAIVLLTNYSTHPTIAGDPILKYNDKGGAVTGDHIRTIVRERRIRPGSAAYRDYNFLRPTREMTAREETSTPNEMGTLTAREIYEYPGHYNDPDGENIGVADDVQVPRRSGKDRAKLRLEELRSDAFTFSGTTNCLRMRVGRVFEIKNHPDDAFNRKYTITRLGFRGKGADAPALEQGTPSSGVGLSIKFWAVPAETPIRPRLQPKPKAHLRTARVVGPKEDEPYVDAYGRIKIQFAWDREGPRNDKSSCWVRMMTPVAHFKQGTYIAHRVGAEVLVDFLDGDVDRPMVVGAVFNEDNRQPQDLPDDATRAVLYRGLSVPGNSDGTPNVKKKNEISCEDRAGHEEIYVHAQKDLNEQILNCHSESIGVNQSSTIGKDQMVTVGKNQTITVKDGDRKVRVEGNEKIHISKKRTEDVITGELVNVWEGREHHVMTGNDELTVNTGSREVRVAALHDIYSQARKENVQTWINVNAGTSIHLHREDDAHLLLSSNLVQANTPQSIMQIAGGTIMLSAADEIKLVCGAASLSLKSDGTIAINGKTIAASGSTAVGLACGNSTLKLEPTAATLSAKSTTVKAKGVTTIAGGIIMIG